MALRQRSFVAACPRPTELDLMLLKKIGNQQSSVCGKHWRTVQMELEFDREEDSRDSDFAWSKQRTSASGGAMLVGGVVVKRWGKSQKVIALSSGEAEL